MAVPGIHLSVFFFLMVLFAYRCSSSIDDLLTKERFPRQATEYQYFLQRIWDFRQYYNMTRLPGDANKYWRELKNDSRHRTLSNSSGTYDEVFVDFEFEFFGHTIKRIYLSTAGLLSMSPFKENIPVTHYIAPFYGAFNPSYKKESAIYFENYYGEFIAEWRNVYLRNLTSLGPFTFQAQVDKGGTIIFIYKQMPQNLTVHNNEFLIGIVGSINIEVAGINLLAYYDPVQVLPLDIESGMVIMFNPLKTCDSIKDKVSCFASNLPFDCKWCSAVNKCSDALDRHTKEWEMSGCLDEEFSLMPFRRTTHRHTVGVTASITTSTPTNSSNNYVGIIVIVVIVVLLLGALVGFIIYAYKNPESKSGRWIIEHRPSQWKTLFARWRGFSRQEEDKPPY